MYKERIIKNPNKNVYYIQFFNSKDLEWEFKYWEMDPETMKKYPMEFGSIDKAKMHCAEIDVDIKEI